MCRLLRTVVVGLCFAHPGYFLGAEVLSDEGGPADLELTVPCDLRNEEAVSAVRRAKSKKCKAELATLACRLQEDDLYPHNLPNLCPDWDSALFTAGVQYGTNGMTFVKQQQELKQKKGHFPPVKIVFFLTLNGRSTRQVRRLVKALYSPDHYILVHVDSNSEFLHRDMRQLEAILPNLRLTSRRRHTAWGGVGLLRMMLDAMEELMGMEDWTWDFVMNLSESTYPLKPVSALTTFLSQHRDKNFLKTDERVSVKTRSKSGVWATKQVDNEPLKIDNVIEDLLKVQEEAVEVDSENETTEREKKSSLNMTFHECDGHMWRLGDRNVFKSIQALAGSDWFCLNRDFVKYSVTSQDDLVTGLKAIFLQTILPLESFFHTLIKNSRFCQSFVENNLLLVNWKRSLGCEKLSFGHEKKRMNIDWKMGDGEIRACSPNDYRASDWKNLLLHNDSQLFFARKFEAIVDQEIVNKIDEIIQPRDGVVRAGSAAKWRALKASRARYWHNTFHHRDGLPPDRAAHTVMSALVNKTLASHQLELVNVEEVTSFNFNDAYNATLVLADVKDKESLTSGRMEFKIARIPRLKMFLSDRDADCASVSRGGDNGEFCEKRRGKSRLSHVSVSTDYDSKERILRNSLGVVCASCQPVVRLAYVPGDPRTVDLIWMDPMDEVVAANRVYLKDWKGGVEGVYPRVGELMKEGVWRLVVVEEGQVVMQVYFPVVNELNDKADPVRNETEERDLDSNLANIVSAMKKEKRWNSRDSENNFNNLVDAFYEVTDVCFESKHPLSSSFSFREAFSSCEETDWSSRTKDDKSNIQGMSSATGHII